MNKHDELWAKVEETHAYWIAMRRRPEPISDAAKVVYDQVVYEAKKQFDAAVTAFQHYVEIECS